MRWRAKIAGLVVAVLTTTIALAQIYTPTAPQNPANLTLKAGGTAQFAFLAGEIQHGCAINNPPLAADQNIAAAEEIWVDFTGAPAVAQSGSTSNKVLAGSGIGCPASTAAVSWIATTVNHRISGFRW